jgi:hypothetical protein
MFKSLVGKGHAEFSTNHQQDAQEFLLYLLDMIDKIQVSLKWTEFHITFEKVYIRLCLLASSQLFDKLHREKKKTFECKNWTLITGYYRFPIW